jgi:hypothetical protein
MTNFQAAIVAGGIVAAAAVFSQNTIAQTDLEPRFQIASGGDRTVWRLDTQSGAIDICAFRGNLPTNVDPDSRISGDIRCEESRRLGL